MKLIDRVKIISKRIWQHTITCQNLSTPDYQYFFSVIKLEFIRKFKLKAQYKKYGLVSANIETLSSCNRTCEFCFNHPRFDQRSQGKMSVSLWKSIIDQLSEINFSGRIGPHFYNEPLLDKRLPELISYARMKLPNVWLQLNSNGDYLNEEILIKLYNSGINYFFITNYDDDEKEDLLKLQKKYPALIKIVNNRDMWRTDRGGKIFNKNAQINTPCLRPASQLVVNWEGKVLLCCMDFYAQYEYGDLNKEALVDIWSNPEFSKIKEQLIKSRQNGLPICKNCDDPGIIPW